MGVEKVKKCFERKEERNAKKHKKMKVCKMLVMMREEPTERIFNVTK